MLDICYEELEYLKEHIDEGKEILRYDLRVRAKTH